MADIDKIRAKLRALRAKTVDNGCTEEGAVAAAEKAAELLSRYGLSEADLEADDYLRHEVPMGRRSPLDDVWFAVARFADCRGWYTRCGRELRFTFFGREQDTLVAEYVYEVLKGACARALAEFRASPLYQRRRTKKTRAHAVKAFQEGLARSLANKLDRGLWGRYGAGQADSNQTSALIKATRGHLEAMMEAQGIKLGTARPLKSAAGKFKDDASAHGRAAGYGIDVNAGIGAAPARVAGLLG